MFKIKVHWWDDEKFYGERLGSNNIFEVMYYTPRRKREAIDNLEIFYPNKIAIIHTYDDLVFALAVEKWMKDKDNIELEIYRNGSIVEIDELGYLKDDNLYCSMRDVVRRITDIRLGMLRG